MYRSILTCVFIAAVCASLSAQQDPQQTSPSDPYQGVSHPPADNTIEATQPDQPDQPTPPPAKPRAGKLLAEPAPAQPPSRTTASPSTNSRANDPNSDAAGNDDGIVAVAPLSRSQRPVSPRAKPPIPTATSCIPIRSAPGELPPGAMIRVHLLTRLSTAQSQRGDEFRATRSL